MLRLLRARRFAPLFLTQFLGALNDNVLKSALIVVLTFGAAAQTGASLSLLINLCTALLILPFFLFSALAGQIADRVDKAKLIRGLKLAEIVIMGVATLGFAISSVPLLMTALFLMGSQSAFFGPVKYGVLPQHLEDGELVAGNALIELGTFTSILLGTIAGGLMIAIPSVGTFVLTATLMLTAASGFVSARYIPDAPPAPAAREVALDLNLFRATKKALAIGRQNRAVHLSILGASWFWFVGAFLLGQLPMLAKEVLAIAGGSGSSELGSGEQSVTTLLAVFSLGVGLGSILCERLTHGKVEVALVPIAGLLLSAFGFDLAYVASTFTSDQLWRVYLDLVGVGMAGGLFIVPLYALMQARAPEGAQSRVVAANNIMNAGFMVVSTILAVVLAAADIDVAGRLAIVFALNLIIAGVCLMHTHREVIHVAIRRLVRFMYRVEVEGLEQIPEEGAALIVCNHVSWVDAFILGGLTERQIRFVMGNDFFSMPLLNSFFKVTRAIPIASRRENPELLKAAFDEIDLALENGDLVGIFPEGKLTRDGELNPFKPGVEKILARRQVPVVPVVLKGLWGSFFSFKNGKPMRAMPRRAFSKIGVACGAPIAPEGLRAKELEQVVAKMLAE